MPVRPVCSRSCRSDRQTGGKREVLWPQKGCYKSNLVKLCRKTSRRLHTCQQLVTLLPCLLSLSFHPRFLFIARSCSLVCFSPLPLPPLFLHQLINLACPLLPPAHLPSLVLYPPPHLLSLSDLLSSVPNFAPLLLQPPPPTPLSLACLLTACVTCLQLTANPLSPTHTHMDARARTHTHGHARAHTHMDPPHTHTHMDTRARARAHTHTPFPPTHTYFSQSLSCFSTVFVIHLPLTAPWPVLFCPSPPPPPPPPFFKFISLFSTKGSIPKGHSVFETTLLPPQN